MKKLKELFNKYHNKLSVVVIICYVLLPLLLMYNNYHHVSIRYIQVWYRLTFILGCISGAVGLFNLIFNIKKISIRNFMPFILITILLILCFIAAYTSINRTKALEGEWYRHVGFYTYLLFLGFYLNAINVEKKDYKLIGTVFAIVSTIISVTALLNNSFTHNVFLWQRRPYNGIFTNANHFGYYLSISVIVMIFLTLYEKNTIKKIIYYTMMTISFIMIIANDTFGSYLGVLVGLIFISIYSLIKKKNSQIIYIVLLFFVLSFMVGTTNGSIVKNNFCQLFSDLNIIKNSNDKKLIEKTGSSRTKLWKYTYKLVKKNPWFGVGPNIVAEYYWKDGIGEGVPHNFLLEMASYNGIPALIVYLALLGYIFIRCLINGDKYNMALLTCMASYLTSAFFGNMFFNNSPNFVIVMGMLSSDIILEDKINKKLKKENKKITHKKL